MIFNVGRQALQGSTRLCLRQLWNEQGKPEVQTCTANSLLLCPFGLSNTLARQASRLQARLSRAVVCCGGRNFTTAHPLDLSLQPKRSPNLRGRWTVGFLFLEELGAHGPRYDLCFSAPFPARETNRQLQAAAFQSSFSGSDSILQMRKCAEIYFSRFKSLGWDPWFPTEWQVAAFSAGHTCEAYDPCRSNVARPGMDSGLFLVSKHIFQQRSSGPKSVDQVRQLVSVLCQNLLVWPRWNCWFVLRSWFFSAPSSILQCWAGVQVALGHGVLRWSDLQHSKDLTLTDDALVGITWRMKKRSVQVLGTALRMCTLPPTPKMKVSPELEKILNRARAPNQLSIFLEKEPPFGVDDVALVCTKEELLDETLIAPARAGSVPCDSLSEKVCLKKS